MYAHSDDWQDVGRAAETWAKRLDKLSLDSRKAKRNINPAVARYEILELLNEVQPAVESVRRDAIELWPKFLDDVRPFDADYGREMLPPLQLAETFFGSETIPGACLKLINNHRSTPFRILGEAVIASGAHGYPSEVEVLARRISPTLVTGVTDGEATRIVSFDRFAELVGQAEFCRYERAVLADEFVAQKDVQILERNAHAELGQFVNDFYSLRHGIADSAGDAAAEAIFDRNADDTVWRVPGGVWDKDFIQDHDIE
jgi:hypothetical protein